MTTKYSEDFMASIIARLLSPNNAEVPEVSKETGILKDSLYYWRLKYGGTGSSKAIESGNRASSAPRRSWP